MVTRVYYVLFSRQQAWRQSLDADQPQRCCCFVDSVGLPENCDLRLVPAPNSSNYVGSTANKQYRLRVSEDSSENAVSAELNYTAGGHAHDWQ